MTQLGKILVIVLTVLATLFFGMVAFVLLHATDYYTPIDTPNRDPGKVPKKAESIKKAYALLNTTESRWVVGRQQLEKLEQARLKSREWYDKEFAKLDKGDKPVQEVQYRAGQVVWEQNNPGRPALQDAQEWLGVPPKPLRSEKSYLTDLAATTGRTGQLDKELLGLFTETTKLGKKLEGPKGLRQREKDEAEKFKHAVAEEKELQGLWAKTKAEFSSMKNRKWQLEERIKELYQLSPRRP